MNKVLTVIAMGAMLPLCAQTEDIRFGVKAGLIQPQGKVFKEKARIGAQIGLSATKDLGSGHAVRANLDFSKFANKKVNFDVNTGERIGKTDKKIKEECVDAPDGATWTKLQTKVNTGSIGVDYIYHFNKQDDGFYALAGIDVEKYNYDAKTISRKIEAQGTLKDGKVKDQKWSKWENLADDKNKEKTHKHKVGFKLGAGYALDKNMGIEATYSLHNYGKTVDKDNKSDKHGVLGLGLTYKF